MSRLYSLARKKDFDLVFKKGRSSFDTILGVKYLANDLKKNRLGIIISSKVSKKAVERNRLRRRLREIFRPRLTARSNCDFIAIALSGATAKTFSELERSVDRHLARLGPK